MICHVSKCLCLYYYCVYGDFRAGYDHGYCIGVVLDLRDNNSKSSDNMMKDVVIYIIYNIKFFSNISPLRELKLYNARS